MKIHILYLADINERLYEEGLKKRKKKEKEVLDRDEEKKSEITSWLLIP